MQGVRRLLVDQLLQADNETTKMQAAGRQLYYGSLQGGRGDGIGGGDGEGRRLGGGSVLGEGGGGGGGVCAGRGGGSGAGWGGRRWERAACIGGSAPLVDAVSCVAMIS